MFLAFLLGGSPRKVLKRDAPKPTFCYLLSKAQEKYPSGYHDAQGHKGGEFKAKDPSASGSVDPMLEQFNGDLKAYHTHKLGLFSKGLSDYVKTTGNQKDDTAVALAKHLGEYAASLKGMGVDHQEIAKSLTKSGLGPWLKKKHGLPLTTQEQKNIDSTMKAAVALQNKKQAAKKLEDHKKNLELAEKAKAEHGEDSKEHLKFKAKAAKDLAKAMSYGVLPADAAHADTKAKEEIASNKEAQGKAIHDAAANEAPVAHNPEPAQDSAVEPPKEAIHSPIQESDLHSPDEVAKLVESGHDAHAEKVAKGKSLLTQAVHAHAQVQHQKDSPKNSPEYAEYKNASASYKHHYNTGADDHGLSAEDKAAAVKAGKQAHNQMKYGHAEFQKVIPPDHPGSTPVEVAAPTPPKELEAQPEAKPEETPAPPPSEPKPKLTPGLITGTHAIMKNKLCELAAKVSTPDINPKKHQKNIDAYTAQFAKVSGKIGEQAATQLVANHLTSLNANKTQEPEKPPEVKALEEDKPVDPPKEGSAKLPKELPTDKKDAETLNESLAMKYYGLRLQHGVDNHPDVVSAYEDWNKLKDHMKSNLGYTSSYFSETSSKYKAEASKEHTNKAYAEGKAKEKALTEYQGSVEAWHTSSLSNGANHESTLALKEKMVAAATKANALGHTGVSLSGAYNGGISAGNSKHDVVKAGAKAEIASAHHAYIVNKLTKGEDHPDTLNALNNTTNIIEKHQGVLTTKESLDATEAAEKSGIKTAEQLKALGDLGSVAKKYDDNASNFKYLDSEGIKKAATAGTKVWNKLSEDTKSAFKSYTGAGYKAANKVLAGTSDSEWKNAANELMTKAMEGQSLGQDMKLRRNMPQKWFFKALGLPNDTKAEMDNLAPEKIQALIGKVYREPGFSSTSYDKDQSLIASSTAQESGGLVLNIRAAKGVANGLFIAKHSTHKHEMEVILNKGATYIIRGIKKLQNNGTFSYQVDLDIIGHTPESKK